MAPYLRLFFDLLLAGHVASHRPLGLLQKQHNISVVKASADRAVTIDQAMAKAKHWLLQEPEAKELRQEVSPQCQAAIKKEEQAIENGDATGISDPNQPCPHTPCTLSLMVITKKSGRKVSEEGPVCLPKECMGPSDLNKISGSMQDMLQGYFGERAQILVELNCRHAGGSTQEAGKVKEVGKTISVDEDYVNDAQPLSDSGRTSKAGTMPVQKPKPSGPKRYSAAAALAPVATALAASVVGLVLP